MTQITKGDKVATITEDFGTGINYFVEYEGSKHGPFRSFGEAKKFASSLLEQPKQRDKFIEFIEFATTSKTSTHTTKAGVELEQVTYIMPYGKIINNEGTFILEIIVTVSATNYWKDTEKSMFPSESSDGMRLDSGAKEVIRSDKRTYESPSFCSAIVQLSSGKRIERLEKSQIENFFIS